MNNLIDLRETPFQRLWRVYLAARVLVALLLAVGALLLAPPQARQLLPQLAILAIYAALGIVYAAINKQPPPQRRVYAWLPTIGLDLLLISLLEIIKFGTYTLTPLFGLAVLFAGILGGWMVVMGTCAYITIFLLSHALTTVPSVLDPDGAQNVVQAALAGAAYFFVGALVRLLGARVERETLIGLRAAASANQQEQVNALILQNLPDGVLVADQNLQPIGFGVFLGRDDARADDAVQPLAQRRDLFDLEADRRQRRRQLLAGGVGLDVLAQPVFAEFHAEIP